MISQIITISSKDCKHHTTMEAGNSTSSMWCSISDLHPMDMKMNAAIKVRFVRIFENTSPKNRNEIFSIEAIVHDSKGDRISLSIPRIFVKKWKSVLKEESVYGIKNFMVVHNTGKYKISTHDYKMKFNFETDVKRMMEEKFPKQIFVFKPYEEILKMDKIKDGDLFDVIGILLNKPVARSVSTYNGAQKILLDLILQDTEGKRITCTLWEEYVDQFLKSLKENEQPSNVIILQLGKPDQYGDKMKMQSALFVSRVTINANIQEVDDFRKRVDIATDLNTTIIGSASEKSTSCLTNNEPDTTCQLKTIYEVNSIKEDGIYWIVGKVVGIGLEEGWFYISCKACNKKLLKQKQNFYCTKCNKTDTCGSMRYRMIVDVKDETSITTLILWERECVQIIGKSVADLVQNECWEHDIPDDIYNRVMGQTFMFKVSIKEKGENDFKRPYSVMQANSDLTYINAYNRHIPISEGLITVSNLEESKASFDGDEEIIPIETPMSKLEEAKKSEEDKHVKRSLVDEFSATTPMKKTKTFIKVEKQ